MLNDISGVHGWAKASHSSASQNPQSAIASHVHSACLAAACRTRDGGPHLQFCKLCIGSLVQ